MTRLFPQAGDSREDQEAARKLAWRVRDAVQAAILARIDAGAQLRLDVRVSRRRGAGHCIILHRVPPTGRRESASGAWLPWSWPLTDFTPEDAAFLAGGQLPALLRPCVMEWSARLRQPSSDPSLTL